MGTCRLTYQEFIKKRETHVKKTFKLNTFVSILVPYSQPQKPLTHNNRARKKRPESARGAEDRRTQRRRAPTTIHHVFFFFVVVVRHLRHRGLDHASRSRRPRRDDPRPSRRDLLPVVEIIRIVQRAASSPLVDAGCLLGILLWFRRRGVPRRRRTTQSNRRGR